MRMRFIVIGLAFGLAACATRSSPLAKPIAHIDHLIVGVADLEAGIDLMEQLTGVRAVIGGSHPGSGTRNALMSLGDGTYLEQLAPDPGQALDNAEIRELRSLTKPTPIGWAVSGATEADLRDSLVARGISLSQSVPGSRRKPDGSILRWTTLGYAALDNPLAPFFIFWDDPPLHPSRTSPRGCRLGEVKIDHAAAEQLRQAIDPLRLGISITAAPTPRMLVTLRCKGRRLILG